ncbi:MAG: DUF4926 domain-containing protein [Candidatus Levybacteria bacterium]|nr:DUF4926 domain-containing protein [Candidatus Levybacteria bacterium]
MFVELDTIVLKRDIKKHSLKKGDIGVIVHCYNDGKAIEAEFLNASGKTVALLTLSPVDVRPMERSEILHVRGLVSA